MHEQYISDEDIQNHIHMQLVKRGYAPAESELIALTDIFFDYLAELGIIQEYFEE